MPIHIIPCHTFTPDPASDMRQGDRERQGPIELKPVMAALAQAGGGAECALFGQCPVHIRM